MTLGTSAAIRSSCATAAVMSSNEASARGAATRANGEAAGLSNASLGARSDNSNHSQRSMGAGASPPLPSGTNFFQGAQHVPSPDERLSAAQRRAEVADRRSEALEAELAKLRAEAEAMRREQDALRDASRRHRAAADAATAESQALKHEAAARKERDARAAALLTALAHRGAECARELCKRHVDASVGRLGRPGVVRTGLSVSGGGLREVWEEGTAVRDVAQRLYSVTEEKAELERRRADVEARRSELRKQGGASAAAPPTSGGEMPPPPAQVEAEDTALREAAEALRARLSTLSREKATLESERERLEREKIGLAHEMRRQRDEEASRFLRAGAHNRTPAGAAALPAPFPAHASWTIGPPVILNSRYLLLSLIGKGGFSEVCHAVDLKEQRAVACKLHQLSNLWKEERKASYVKHAIREVNIHKRLRHANVVAHLDVFEIDAESFCTVLELCKGPDLEHVLRQHGPLPEREVKSVVRQIMAALRYVSAPPRRIIHYDLKPANVLFDEAGTAKISDFGLSKEMDGDVAQTSDGVVSVSVPPGSMSLGIATGAPSRIELTSVGAGTYWYLPPECFPGATDAGDAPQISSKVDVWSVGVLTYQALFGQRPFAHAQSQETIYREGSIAAEARKGVQFPPRPPVSEEAKRFLSRLLAYHQEDRPDVATAAVDPWLRA